VILLLAYGGRDFKDEALLDEGLMSLVARYDCRHVCIMHGGARGADQMAGVWAEKHGIHLAIVPALWSYFGPRAGPLRNEMMASFRPQLGAAFPGGRGTAHMTVLLKAAGIPVHEFSRGDSQPL
jgi:hypothetical protein